MKLILVTVLAVVVSAAPRAKRGFGGAPCVVTGNELYINGIYERNLTSSEQQELSQYQDSLTQYETALQSAIDQRRQDRQNSRNGGNGGMRGGMGRNGGMGENGGMGGNGGMNNNNSMQSSLPQPPERPSFCSDDAITQYIFDGCMIQDNKVYVGKQYARTLSASEVQQLQDFDSQMSAYQDYLQQQLQSVIEGEGWRKEFFQQVQNLFGSGFLSQFGGNGGSSTMPSTTGATSSPGPAPQQPTAPNFCTAIY